MAILKEALFADLLKPGAPAECERNTFSNENLGSVDKKNPITIRRLTIRLSSLHNIGLTTNTIVSECFFLQTTFEDCYFRTVNFKNVDFTGSTFRNCNFEKSTFDEKCAFYYCTFDNCYIRAEEIMERIPDNSRPNQRMTLARNLKTNFANLGDKESSDIFMGIEIEAEEADSWGIFRNKSKYYKSKHNSPKYRFAALIKYFNSKLSGLIWGYGFELTNLFISYIAVLLIITAIICIGNVPFQTSDSNHTAVIPVENIGKIIFVVFSYSINYASTDYSPASFCGKTILFVTSFLGIVYLGMLAATLYRKIAR
jgi:hypothetical protein